MVECDLEGLPAGEGNNMVRTGRDSWVCWAGTGRVRLPGRRQGARPPQLRLQHRVPLSQRRGLVPAALHLVLPRHHCQAGLGCEPGLPRAAPAPSPRAMGPGAGLRTGPRALAGSPGAECEPHGSGTQHSSWMPLKTSALVLPPALSAELSNSPRPGHPHSLWGQPGTSRSLPVAGQEPGSKAGHHSTVSARKDRHRGGAEPKARDSRKHSLSQARQDFPEPSFLARGQPSPGALPGVA